MTPKTYSYKDFFSSEKMVIEEQSLHITTSSIVSGKKEWFIALIDIQPSFRSAQAGLFPGGCVAGIFIVIVATLLIIQLNWLTTLIILLISISPLLIGKAINHYSYFEISTRQGSLFIKYSKKNKAEAETFLQSLKNAMKEYMKWRYWTIDPDLDPLKQFENFWWLRNNAYITDEEYQSLKAKLKDALKKPQ